MITGILDVPPLKVTKPIDDGSDEDETTLAIRHPAHTLPLSAYRLVIYCQTDYTSRMPTMNVSLPEDLSGFVAEQLKEGYHNQSEVVRDALRLLRARNDKLRQLRAAIAAGLDDIEAGRTKPLTDDLLREIADRARTDAAPDRARRSEG
jgi:antitoxin ParD1/3/4